MYHLSHTIDGYEKRERNQLAAPWDEVNKIYITSANRGKTLSNERTEKQDIGVNVTQNKDCEKEKGSSFLKTKSNESLYLSMKMHKNLNHSNKPLVISKEPHHYSEFATKLDFFVDKVMDLAKSSGELSVKNSKHLVFKNVSTSKSSDSLNLEISYPNKNGASNTQENTKETLGVNRNFEEPFLPCILNPGYSYYRSDYSYDLNPIANDNEKAPKVACGMTDHKADSKLPPIMNNTIRYIRVSSKDSNRSESSICHQMKAPINGMKRNLETGPKLYGQETSVRRLELDSYLKQISTMKVTEQETFRFLISGHLTRETPVFILHKNYIQTGALIKDTLDFRTHKNRGNVDISLTGKYFHDNILMENDRGHPSALDLKSHRILIDRKSKVAYEKFKHIFRLGKFDAVLEGEFVANSETFQYIPLFSLEVVKHKPDENDNFDKATSVILTDECSQCKKEKENAETLYSSQERVHDIYATSIQEDNIFNNSKDLKKKKTNEKPKEGKLSKLKDSVFSFLRRIGNCSYESTDSRNLKLALNTTGMKKTNKTTKHLRKNEENRQVETQNNLKFNSNEICEGSINGSTSSQKKHKKEVKITERKATKRKQSPRHSHEIAENPGLSQMQGFFFQT